MNGFVRIFVKAFFVKYNLLFRFYNIKLKYAEDSAKPAQVNKEKIEKYREKLWDLNKRKNHYKLMLKQKKFPKYYDFLEAGCDIRKFNVGLFMQPESLPSQIQQSITKSFRI